MHLVCKSAGRSGLEVRHSVVVCEVPGLKPVMALCLSQQPLQYTALGMGCAPLLHCLGPLNLPPLVGW